MNLPNMFLYLLLVSSCFSQYTFSLYSSAKDSIKLPSYTPNQRQLVADQVKNMMSVYVNRESKIKNYNVDPVPEANRIAKLASLMSDEEFQRSTSNMFLSLHLPRPYACYLAVFPIKFTLVEGYTSILNPIVAVKGFLNQKVQEFSPEVMKSVRLGDILVKINGLSFPSFVEKYQMFSGGANNFGSQRSIINFLSFRSGKMNFLPSETEIVYEFKRSINSNETYTVTGNIVAAADQSCLAGNSDDSSQFDSDPFPGAPEIPFNDQLNMMKHPYMDDLKAMSEPDYDASLSLKPTDSDIVSWDIYTSLKNEKLGVLRLDSFMPSNDTTGGMKTVLTIRSLLLNELANTDSLVIDIRDNGGGLITIANFIPQFFTKDFVPGTGRALISPINEIMFTQTPQFKDSIWDTAYRSTPPGSIYSNRVMFNTKDESNDFGQVYFKPVAVFNNAQCYSACDKFSANMQDSAGAIVFGEDPNTGAGGANVVEYNSFFGSALPSMFPKLPGNQNMRVGWRQSLRAGLYEGQLIEDIGISAEKVIRPTLQDLVPSNKISTQFERIAGLLSSIGRDTGKLYSNFKTEIDLQSDLFIGSNLSFAFESSWFTKIEARTILGNVVASIELAKSVNVVKTNLVGTELIDAPSIVRFSIAGWIDDTLSFLTTRYIRQVPRLYDRLSLDINTYSKFDLSSKSLLVYNRGSNADFGWNTVDGKIVIRDGKGYNDITDSAISIFVLVSSSDSKFTISAEYDTEADFDFLYGTVKQGDKVLKTLWSVSGKGALENSYALGEFVGQQVEIEVRFVSDPAMNVGPIVISSISLSG